MSIKHSPKSHIPAVRKGPDDCFKVTAIVDSEQVNDVLKDHPARLNLFEDSYDLPEKAAAFAAQSAAVSVAFPAAGDADVLAGESGGEDIDGAEVVSAALAHVFKLLCMGKSIGKHSPVDRVEFNLPGAAVPW